jgi:hypothetical protein
VRDAAGQHSLDPALIARTLRAVADELERDPALAHRVASGAGRAFSPAMAESPSVALVAEEGAPVSNGRQGSNRPFRPRLVTGAAADLGMGIPDPFALQAQRGPAGLRAVLDELRLGTLRAIVREHRLDPSGRLTRHNDAERLRDLILAATNART